MCLRLADSLEEISGQIGVFGRGTRATITSLSRPVGAIRGKIKVWPSYKATPHDRLRDFDTLVFSWSTRDL